MSKRKCYAVMAAFVVLLALSLALPIIAAAYNPITVTINGYPVTFQDQGPVMINNRVLVPVREVFEKMGFDVSWDPDTRMARLMTPYHARAYYAVTIPADISFFRTNGRVITTDVPQQLINNRLMLPLRAVAEAVGATATWDAASRTATIVSPHCKYPENYPQPCRHFVYPRERTIENYRMFRRPINNVLFDVEFIVVDGSNLVSVTTQTYADGYSAFTIWAALNNVKNVELIEHILLESREAHMHISGQLIGGGRSRGVDLTLSSEFLSYLKGENGLLLAESLTNTFKNLWQPGSIRVQLIVAGDVVFSSTGYFHRHC